LINPALINPAGTLTGVVLLDRLGVACGYAVALTAGELMSTDSALDWASTNLANLRHRPVAAMVVSAFLAEDDRIAWVLLALTGIAATGWILGAWRTAVLLGAAHVVATLISEGVLALRIAAGAVPAAQEHIRDVGPSYVVIAALTAGLLYGTWPWRVPCAIGFALMAPGSFGGLPRLELAAMGHVCAVLIAAGLGLVMVRRRRAATPARASGPVP
jgi:hypothetical protein